MSDLSASSAVTATLLVDGESLDVLSYRYRVELFEPSRLVCWVTCDDGSLPEPERLLGKTAEFELSRDVGGSRIIVGQCVSVRQQHADDDVTDLELVIVPPLFFLSQRTDCRIFQNKSTPEIVREVLVSAQIPESDQSWLLSDSYPPRIQTCQYRETDLDFVRRLLSEEGIYFVCRTEDKKPLVVFSDDPQGLGDVEGTTELPYLADFGVQGADDAVYRLSQQVRVRSGRVVVRDYDPEHPDLSLEATATGADPLTSGDEIYLFPARALDTATLKRYAKVLVDAASADRAQLRGETGCLSFEPGLCFGLVDHPYVPLNQRYLITDIEVLGHQRRGFGLGSGRADEEAGSDFGFECRFGALPASGTRYRPQSRAAARAIPGLQTAFTTGPAGEEIHTNERGEVTAHFHWDRTGPEDHQSSRFLRTSQMALGGSMLIPRMGWEVGVNFCEGDPDLPFVMSRLTNPANPPPYPLPANKAKMSLQTATTPGGGSTNEIRMSDTKGDEQMFFNASKDMSTEVGHNMTESIGANHTIDVGANQELKIADSLTTTVSADQSLTVGANQKLTVGTLMVDDVGGSHSLSIGGKRTMMIGGDHRRTVGGSSTEDTGTARIDLVVGSVTNETLADMTHEVGAAVITLCNGGRTVMAGGDRTENTGVIKAIVSKGDRSVSAASLNRTVGGAIVNMIKGGRNENAQASYTDMVAGAQLIKASNVTFEADVVLSLVMGASTITLTPVSVIVAGVAIKVDGQSVDLGLIMNN